MYGSKQILGKPPIIKTTHHLANIYIYNVLYCIIFFDIFTYKKGEKLFKLIISVSSSVVYNQLIYSYNYINAISNVYLSILYIVPSGAWEINGTTIHSIYHEERKRLASNLDSYCKEFK
jgi:hypothetical protein